MRLEHAGLGEEAGRRGTCWIRAGAGAGVSPESVGRDSGSLSKSVVAGYIWLCEM